MVGLQYSYNPIIHIILEISCFEILKDIITIFHRNWQQPVLLTRMVESDLNLNGWTPVSYRN